MVVALILSCCLLSSGLATLEFTTINGERVKIPIPGPQLQKFWFGHLTKLCILTHSSGKSDANCQWNKHWEILQNHSFSKQKAKHLYWNRDLAMIILNENYNFRINFMFSLVSILCIKNYEKYTELLIFWVNVEVLQILNISFCVFLFLTDDHLLKKSLIF